MGMDLMPKEVYEALRDLDMEGQDADLSPAMIQILQDGGYVEIIDGIPTVTEAGLVALRTHERNMPTFFVKPPSD
ncbi:hypothetical protein ACMDCR_18620 [Labrys okinawensis]|uniref:hypothetical protein n=1 Tax=Labrys okinawensis TaxID=346911 RepID=UPI0039BC7BFB